MSGDDTGATTYTGDNIAIHTLERVVFDLGAGIPAVDAFCLFFDKLSGNQFSGSAIVKLRANATDSWAAPSVDITLSFDPDFPSSRHFFGSDQSFRYWAIEIVDTDNPNLYVELSTIILSDSLQLTQIAEVGFKEREIDQSQSRRNDFGHEFYDQFPLRVSRSFEYKALTEADKLELKKLFRRVGRSVPFGFALDTSEGTFSNTDEYLMYARFGSDYGASHVVFSFFDSQFDLIEVI